MRATLLPRRERARDAIVIDLAGDRLSDRRDLAGGERRRHHPHRAARSCRRHRAQIGVVRAGWRAGIRLWHLPESGAAGIPRSGGPLYRHPVHHVAGDQLRLLPHLAQPTGPDRGCHDRDGRGHRLILEAMKAPYLLALLLALTPMTPAIPAPPVQGNQHKAPAAGQPPAAPQPVDAYQSYRGLLLKMCPLKHLELLSPGELDDLIEVNFHDALAPALQTKLDAADKTEKAACANAVAGLACFNLAYIRAMDDVK